MTSRFTRKIQNKIQETQEDIKRVKRNEEVKDGELVPIIKISRRKKLVTCPNCLMPCIPNERYKFTAKTYSMILYLTFILMCWLPYVFKKMRCIVYHCPFCKASLGYSEINDKNI